MSYVDYRSDLDIFNSLMESVDPVVLLENEAELKPNDADGTDKDPEKEKGNTKGKEKDGGALITAAIRKALVQADDKDVPVRRELLFQCTYLPDDKKPAGQFYLVGTEEKESDDGLKIKNDHTAENLYQVKDDGTIVVNFSALVYRCSTSTYRKTTLKRVRNWKAEANDTDKKCGFQAAILKALDELAYIITNDMHGIGDLDKYEAEKKEERTKKREEKQKKQQTDDKHGQGVPEDNGSGDNNGQNGNPPEDNGSRDKSGDDIPDVPEDIDQRKLYREIIQEYRDTQQELIASDCVQRKKDIGDDPDERKDAIDDITDKYYTSIIEPYDDKADDDTKAKIRQVIQYNVTQQFGEPTDEGNGNGGERKNGGNGGSGNNGDDKDKEPTEPKDPNKKEEDGKTWWDNTKTAWGLGTNPLYNYTPQGKTLGQLAQGKNPIQLIKDWKKDRDANKQYKKDMAEYKKNHKAWEQRQANKRQANKNDNNGTGQQSKKDQDEFDFTPK